MFGDERLDTPVACREPAISGTSERVEASMAGPLEPAGVSADGVPGSA